MSVSALVWYTLTFVSYHQIIPRGYNWMSDDEAASLTPQERQVRSDGGKWVVASEQLTVLTVWSCKFCMLLLYKRFTYVTSPSSKWRFALLTHIQEGTDGDESNQWGPHLLYCGISRGPNCLLHWMSAILRLLGRSSTRQQVLLIPTATSDNELTAYSPMFIIFYIRNNNRIGQCQLGYNNPRHSNPTHLPTPDPNTTKGHLICCIRDGNHSRWRCARNKNPYCRSIYPGIQLPELVFPRSFASCVFHQPTGIVSFGSTVVPLHQ